MISDEGSKCGIVLITEEVMPREFEWDEYLQCHCSATRIPFCRIEACGEANCRSESKSRVGSPRSARAGTRNNKSTINVNDRDLMKSSISPVNKHPAPIRASLSEVLSL